MSFTPTPEQAAALDAFGTGDDLVIEAGAGTGKTSSLVLLADSTERRVQYLAFNKAIVTDSADRFGENVTANTAHSLAFRAVGRDYGHRLRGSRRMSPTELARLMGIDPYVIRVGDMSKSLAPGFLAGLVMRAVSRYCQTADEVPSARHVPYIEGIDFPDEDGNRTYRQNAEVDAYLAPFIHDVWRDLNNPDGRYPYKHEHYLKSFQLRDPRIDADVVMLDEAQDANPVIAAIVARQTHAQQVMVGDSQQQIYAWTGAVNAMANMDGRRVFLTRSFRFGDQIAGLANRVLARIGAQLRIQGDPGIASEIGPVSDPDVILVRTNAEGVRTVLEGMARNKSVHMVGGGGDISRFAKAAKQLQTEGWTGHPELACFSSWGEVMEYVRGDALGDELALMVRLVNDYGTDKIIEAMDRMPSEALADLVVSTAHKAKGREWDRVQLAPDFLVDYDTGVDELRLLYVAITRARYQLDVTRVPFLTAPGTVAETVLPGVG